MPGKRYIMNAGRTTKQGQQINVGKDSPEYQALVSTLIMNVFSWAHQSTATLPPAAGSFFLTINASANMILAAIARTM